MADKEVLAILLEELSDDTTLDTVMTNVHAATETICDLTDAALMLCAHSTPVRVQGYVEDVVPMYSPGEFQAHFRMQRSSFEALCREVAPHMSRDRSVAMETKVLATLWMLGNMECYRSVADRFGFSKGTLHHIVLQTAQALCNLKEKLIVFPQGRRAFELVANGFQSRCGLPGVVGAIDGTHIPVIGPNSEHRASYINRKGFPSIHLQVVCDSKLRLLDTVTGWPGSVHDARVWRNSPLYEVCQQMPAVYHLIGDSAYPLAVYMIVPYRDNGHLNTIEKKFNKVHSSTRVDVERAICLLKTKFRRLKNLDMLLLDQIPNVITACCVLHNFILISEGEGVIDSEEVDSVVDTLECEPWTGVSDRPGEDKRHRIANML